MKVAIIGSREIGSFSVRDMLPHIPENTTGLVSGGAIGIDSLAEQAARQLGLPIEIISPDYDTNGRLAPLIRNHKIVESADLLLAFWDMSSHGTAHTLNSCVQSGTPFRIVSISSYL